MGTNLNEIIDTGFNVLPAISNESAALVVRRLETGISNAICFDAGDLYFIDEFKIIDDLLRLPYEYCWIEGFIDHQRLGRHVIGSMCVEINGVIYGDAFWRATVGGKHAWFYYHSFEISGLGTYLSNIEFNEKHPWFCEKDMLHSASSSVSRFLSALNCMNVNMVEHKQPEKLQKARVKRGKKPLFSYWTLEIDLQNSRAAGESYGGTHASPRLHLRHGHYRQYAPGKYCFVQPHAVGNKNLGMVHKDYSVK